MDDLSRRSLRELLTLARERLGRGAAGLKTRGELIAALRKTPGGEGVGAAEPAVGLAAASPDAAGARGEAVGARTAEPATRGSTGASPAPPDSSTSERGARAGEPPTVVTRDFFIVRR